MFSIIAAIGENRELGKGNRLVFSIKEDMAYFRDTTMGHKVVMGHRTWDSLPGKLKGRENIVVSRHNIPGADQVIHDLPAFIAEHQDTPEEIFVIGGALIYNEFLKYAKRLYFTEVHSPADADTFFPTFDPSQYSRKVIKEGKENDLTYSFVLYSKH